MALSSAFVAGVVPGFEALGTKLADAFTAGIQAREARRARNQAALLETHRHAQDFGLKQAQLKFQQDQAEKQQMLAQRKFLAEQTAPVLDVSQGLKVPGGSRASSGAGGSLGGGLGAMKLQPGAGQSLQDGFSARNPLDVAQVGQRLARIVQDPRIPDSVRARANDLAARASAAVDRRDEAAYVGLAQEMDALDTLAFGGAGPAGAQGAATAQAGTYEALVSRLVAAGESRPAAEARAQDILNQQQAPALPEAGPAPSLPPAPADTAPARMATAARPQAAPVQTPALPPQAAAENPMRTHVQTKMAFARENPLDPRVLKFYESERVPGHPLSALSQDVEYLTDISVHPDILEILVSGSDDEARETLAAMREEDRLPILLALKELEAAGAQP